jgi:signal transduction histidine kinase
MGNLISTVCHDLRSPLSSIVMGSSFLQKSLAKQDQMVPEKRILESVLRSSERLNALLTDLHDFAHLECGRFDIEKERVDLASLVSVAIDSHRALGAKRSVTVEAGDRPESLAMECDKKRVTQAIGELVENAVRYATPGGVVRVGAVVLGGPSGGRVTFSVSDDGKGMTDEQVAHAFDPYWHASRSPRDGTGLGLALVRGIAVGHGGDAEVTFTGPTGTRMSFWIPIT